jgi:hypothetical protein
MSRAMTWPASSQDEPDAYLFVDHRDMEDELLAALSEFLSHDDAFEVIADEALTVVHRGRRHVIPLTGTPHDRYVALSSASAILDGRYQFYLDRDGLAGDTQAILIVSARWQEAAGSRPDHLISMERGVDYFATAPEGPPFRIPYLGHTEPNFVAAAAEMATQRTTAGQGIDVILSAMLGGQVDESKLRDLARSLAADPKTSGGKNEAEIAAEIRDALREAMADPEIAKPAAEARAALDQVRAMTGQPPLVHPASASKPWWKFW